MRSHRGVTENEYVALNPGAIDESQCVRLRFSSPCGSADRVYDHLISGCGHGGDCTLTFTIAGAGHDARLAIVNDLVKNVAEMIPGVSEVEHAQAAFIDVGGYATFSLVAHQEDKLVDD